MRGNVLALTGECGGILAKLADLTIRVPAKRPTKFKHYTCPFIMRCAPPLNARDSIDLPHKDAIIKMRISGEMLNIRVI